MEELIHMTAAYSNALLVAILPHISDVSRKLELPIVKPVTVEHVLRFRPHPYKGHKSGPVVLKNNYWFAFDEGGYVCGFTSPTNWFSADELAVEHTEYYVGTNTMSSNDIVKLARNTFERLGYPSGLTGTDKEPSVQLPPTLNDGRTVTYARVEWPRNRDSESPPETAGVDVNTQTRTIVGFYLVLPKTNSLTKPLKLDVEPETHAEFMRRNQTKLFTRTNAPPRLPPRTHK
jgi:hypothetical protein